MGYLTQPPARPDGPPAPPPVSSGAGADSAHAGRRRYANGAAFERKTALHLADATGGVVLRAAGSKGDAKADLVAFTPDGRVLVVQCKQRDPKISPAEWSGLWTIVSWGAPWRAGWGVEILGLTKSAGQPVVALVATGGPRAKPGQPWSPRYLRLAGPRERGSRTWPWYVYDVDHGTDVEPGPGHA